MRFNVHQPSYERLRVEHAERRRPIVFWVGAGLSQPAGLPSWSGLQAVLQSKALQIAATLPPTEGRKMEAALEQAAREVSLWDTFQILKREMGKTEFREGVREVLGRSRTAEIPAVYTAIWSLPGVRGVLTLNLDDLAVRSHKRTRLTEDAVPFVGRQAPEYAHVLGEGRPFIANLHGVTDAQGTWVLTRDEITHLVDLPGYREFIGFLFSQMTVVFCGISAEDSAAGGFLQKLTSSGLDLGRHFWITDRADEATHGWAARAGLGIIRYQPITKASSPPDHTSPLIELFSDMRDFISTDVVAPPLIPMVSRVESLPPPQELLSRNADELRALLSGYARTVLSEGGAGSPTKYNEFLRSYAPCVHQAWWITSDEPFNRFYDYRVVEQVSSSPFSSVWRLQSSDGRDLALKVLRIENLGKGPEIEGFRRGIQSLGFLTRASVPGTATLAAAFEIPASLIMEFIEGDSLQNLALSNSFDPWEDGIPLMESVCEHLRYGHNLPQGVLHRDVRPSNILVPYYHWQPDFLEDSPGKHDVRLLNYDMSWHSGARGQTIAGNIEEGGYYAPEDTSASVEAARSTLIDSYGVGMCLYFTFTKMRPPAGGCKSTDWKRLLTEGFRVNSRLRWRSAPTRMRRLVEKATAPEAEQRPMIDQIKAELGLLRLAIQGDTATLPSDFWAEELISQSEQAEYVVDDSTLTFTRTPRPGRSISLSGEVRRSMVVLAFKNQALDSTNRSGIDRLWSEKLQSARDILTSTGWVVREDTRYGGQEMRLSAECSVDTIRANFASVLGGLRRGVDKVRLE